ncbi:MAG: transglutaminase-like domain-containing protein [Marinilabiliales bacterium]|nr:transglutaminase-like domain-containing protein [Marinilabiliales bacterium]
MTLTSLFATRDIAVDLAAPGRVPAGGSAELQKYLEPTELLPTDGIVKQTADEIVRGARSDLEKARAIYEWIVRQHLPRSQDPRLRPGRHQVHAGVQEPEREVRRPECALRRPGAGGRHPGAGRLRNRVADSALGYKSLGKSGDITKAQHCRAEVSSGRLRLGAGGSRGRAQGRPGRGRREAAPGPAW